MKAAILGFSFGISDSIPKSLMLPKPPVESIKFIDVDFVGTTNVNRYTNFSNTDDFTTSPQIGITVDRSANFAKLEDGCPDIRLFTLDDSEGNMWEVLSEPLRDKINDTDTACAYIFKSRAFFKVLSGWC